LLASILEQLIATLGAPWLMAVAGRKTKPVKKTAKKKATPPPAKTKKVSAKNKGKPAARKTKPARIAKRDKKAPAREQPQPVAVPANVKSVEPDMPPKPVPPAGRAILLSPENEKFSESLNPTFRWLSVGGATRYEVAWSEEPNVSQAHSIVSLKTEAAVPVEKPLRLSVNYYWRVRGGNEGGWGPWSAIISFRVLDETA
jgi:hypothetical protein